MTGMKASTIRSCIREKINDICDNILKDESSQEYCEESQKYIIKKPPAEVVEFVEEFKKNVIVTGGAITSMLQGDAPNDFDLYFKDFNFVVKLTQYFVKKFKRNQNQIGGVKYEPEVRIVDKVNIKGQTERRVIIYMKSAGVAGEQQQAYQYFESLTESAADEFFKSTTLPDNMEQLPDEVEDPVAVAQEFASFIQWHKQHSGYRNKYRPVFLTENAITFTNKVQMVIRFYGEPDQIHDNYDFAHCMCYYDYQKDHLELPQEALQSILSKALIYKGSLYPIASIFRIRKFLERGWRITAGQMLKIVYQINELDLQDFEVLKEQLMGVDVAYMRELLDAIQAEKTARVDAVYIAKLIDRIFE